MQKHTLVAWRFGAHGLPFSRAFAYISLYRFTHNIKNWTVNLHVAPESGPLAIYRMEQNFGREKYLRIWWMYGHSPKFSLLLFCALRWMRRWVKRPSPSKIVPPSWKKIPEMVEIFLGTCLTVVAAFLIATAEGSSELPNKWYQNK